MTLDMETRCLQILQVLIGFAANRQTITFGWVVDRIGGLTPVGLGPYLDRVFAYCESRSLPDLTILVVNETTGLPGKYTGDPNAKREAVFAESWFAQVPPVREDFAKSAP